MAVWRDGTVSRDDQALHLDRIAELLLLSEKAIPAAGDRLLIEDSASSPQWAKKFLQVANLPSGGSSPAGVILRCGQLRPLVCNGQWVNLSFNQ